MSCLFPLINISGMFVPTHGHLRNAQITYDSGYFCTHPKTAHLLTKSKLNSSVMIALQFLLSPKISLPICSPYFASAADVDRVNLLLRWIGRSLKHFQDYTSHSKCVITVP